jgi:hypothetical protein
MYTMTCGQTEPAVAPDGRTVIPALVPFAKTPPLLGSRSYARSTWYDLGAVTKEFRPPLATSAGAIDPPLFGVPGEAPLFQGTDPATGFVATDAAGNVLDPFGNDFAIDSPDLFEADFLPQGGAVAQTVKIEFQGADEDPANPGLPLLATASAFVTDPTLLNGRRFVRWQVAFDIAAGAGQVLVPATPKPQMNFLRLPFRY